MEDVMGYVQQAWALNWVQALVIVAASVVLAKIAEVVICRVVTKLTAKTSTNMDDRLIRLLHMPIFMTVVLCGLFTAVKILELPAGVERVTVALIRTVGIVIWTSAGLKIISTLLDGLSRLADRVTWIEARTVPLLDNLAKLFMFGMAIYALLMAWNLDVAPWLASAGIAGIAIGFAAKDTLANLFGGLFVIMDAPYKIGDYINLDSGERGRVVRIGLRSTRLLTRDDVEVTLPNGAIANSKIVNESGGPYEKTRIRIFVGVAYGSDVDRVVEVLQSALDAVDLIIDEPEPRVRFTEMGDSALIFRVLGWIDEPADRGRVIHELNTAVYKRLAEAGLEIPFPQRVVHMAPPAESAA